MMAESTHRRTIRATVTTLLVATLGATAWASTVTQNTSWTIDRAGTTAKYRVVGYGDSIYAGYYGSISRVARRAGPWAEGEYLSQLWNADVEVMRRAKSGAIASDIYNSKIVNERSYMQTANTRVVTFEMCGNDGLQARSSFAGQSGTCNYGVLDNALATCTTYQELAMQYINANAHPNTELKIVANLYYPGYAADNGLAGCNDPTTGQPPNRQEIMLPYIVRMNWRACNFANTYGFECADLFAEYMGADYDSNGDGLVDSEALRYVQGESENDYVTRLTQTLRSTIRDANVHLVNASTSYDYMLSDDTHPTYSGPTVSVGFFGGTGTGTSAPDYPTITGGKNPVWNQFGHERMGWSLWSFSEAPGTTTTTSSSSTTSTAPPTTSTTSSSSTSSTAPPTTTTSSSSSTSSTAPPTTSTSSSSSTSSTAPPTTTTTSSSTTTSTAPGCIADGEGSPCTESTNCCSGTGNCTGGNPASRVCAPPPGTCAAFKDACSVDADCCSLNCKGGTCGK